MWAGKVVEKLKINELQFALQFIFSLSGVFEPLSQRKRNKGFVSE